MYFRWFIIFLAFIATIINYLDRSALSYAITPIETTYHLNNAEFGMIAAGFGVGYMIMTLIGGIIVDSVGAHKTWTASAILWSIACILFGLATGFWMFFALRIALGIAEGPAFPAFTRVVTDWLPMGQRARALAFGLVAVPFSSVIGAPLISLLILAVGWRSMFYILGSLGIIWAIVWFFVFTDKPPDEKNAIISPSEKTHRTTWKFMLTNPSLLSNNYAFFAFGYLLFFALTWLPGYFEQVYHIKLKEIAFFLIAPWLLGSIFLIMGGLLSDYLWKKTKRIRLARSHLIWLCQLLSALCFLIVILWHLLWANLIFISLGIAFGLMPNAVFYAINADLAKDRAATSLGIMDCGFALAGIIAPLLTGILSHLTGNFNAAIGLLIGFTLTSALGVILFQHPDKYIQ